MKIKLTKLKEAENPLHPNNIEDGYVVTGEIDRKPIVGQSLSILRDDVKGLWDRCWGTSTVQEIIDDNTFKTLNSVYKIQYL